MLILDNFVHSDLHPGNIMVTFAPRKSPRDSLTWIMNKIRAVFLDKDSAAAKEADHATKPVPDTAATRRLLRAMSALPTDCSSFQRELVSLYQRRFKPQLVFLDTGLVSELNERERRNFLDLFLSIAEMDGYKAGQLMIERSSDPTTVYKPEQFCSRMESLLLRVQSRSLHLSKLHLASIIGEAMAMVREHHVKMSGEFANVLVSVLILEGLGRRLDPELDLFRVALPLLREVGRQAGGRGMLKEMRPGREAGVILRIWFGFETLRWVHEAIHALNQVDPSVIYMPWIET